MKRATAIGIITTVLGLYGAAAQNSQSPPANPVSKAAPTADNGVAALRHAAEAKQYLFAFVYEQEDEETRAARKTFEAAVAKLTPAAKSVRVDRSRPEEKEMVEKFGLQTAPVPIVLAIAPNGAVTGSICSRRGRIVAIEARGGAGAQAIKGLVPLAETFGYATEVRSITGGRAGFDMRFERYEPVPGALAEDRR